MSKIRAVVFGVGTFGSILSRVMLDRGVEVVGAIAQSEAKVGKDLGEVAGLGRSTGVLVERDAGPLLARTEPDIAVVAVTSYLADNAPHLRACIEGGANTLTIAEEALYPWLTSPRLAAELDELAKANGVTLTGSGLQDALWLNLASLLMAAGDRIDAVSGRFTWDIEAGGVEGVRLLGIGATPEEALKGGEEGEERANFSVALLHCLAAKSGLTVEDTVSDVVLDLAAEPTECKTLGLLIEPGRVIGRTDRDRVTTREGIELKFELCGRIFGPGETEESDWVLEGEPEVKLCAPGLDGSTTTATQAVSRIPDVIAAPPGFVTVDALPAPRYWHLNHGPAPRPAS